MTYLKEVELSRGVRIALGVFGGAAVAPTIFLGLTANSDKANAQPYTTVQHQHFNDTTESQICLKSPSPNEEITCEPFTAADIHGVEVTKSTYHPYNEALNKQAATEGASAVILACVAISSMTLSIATSTRPEA